MVKASYMLYGTDRPACCMSCDNWSELEQGPCSNTEYRVYRMWSFYLYMDI